MCENADLKVGRSHISYRINPEIWGDDARFEALCRALAQCRTGYDDLALFDSFTHSVLACEVVEQRVPLLRKRCAELRERHLGNRIGINFLCTMGHHTENVVQSPRDRRFTNLTGLDGTAVPGCFCVGSEAYRQEHLSRVFTLLAGCGIDFLWLDDDLRFCGHGPVGLVCFCDDCLERFNRAHGTSYTRETLREAFDCGDWRTKLEIRRRWLAFSGERLRSLFAFAAECVHRVDPAIQLGAMDAGMRAGDSASFDELVSALRYDPEKSPLPRWRPGGGAYTDFQMFDEMVLYKATQLGAEAEWLPHSLVDIESEIESFNYQRLRKSSHATAFEGALYCCAGMTGAAWNVLAGNDDFDVNLPLMRALTAARPFYDRVAAANGRLPQRGICALWKPGQAAVSNLAGRWEEKFSSSGSAMMYSELFGAGLPQSFRREYADCFILRGNTVYDYSDAELREIFSAGVYCDAATLRGLEERGLGTLAGFRCGKRICADASEVLTAHELNGADAGFRRDARQSFARFWGDDGGVFALEALPGLESRCEILAELRDYRNELLAPCAMGWFCNDLGGRVAVAGYYPGTNLLFAYKLRQLRSIFNASSCRAGGSLSAWVASYHRVKIFVRRDEEHRRIVIELVNASLDPADMVVLRVRGGGEKAWLTAMEFPEPAPRAEELHGRVVEETTGNGIMRVAEYCIPRLAPWSVNLLETALQ